jgi:hypothetical protein
MPFIPALVEAAVGIGEAVAAGAEAAASVSAMAGAEAGATGAAVGAEAGAVGSEVVAVGSEVGEVGGEAGEVGEVGGEGSSSARNLGDIGKEVFKGAKKGYDIADKFNNVTNNGDNNNEGNVGISPLANAIDSMSGGSSVGAPGSLFRNHESVSEGILPVASESGRAPISDTGEIGAAPHEDSGYLADIGYLRGSGNMRI